MSRVNIYTPDHQYCISFDITRTSAEYLFENVRNIRTPSELIDKIEDFIDFYKVKTHKWWQTYNER